MSTARLEAWVDRLGREEIPTFANTARRMAAISNDGGSSARDLADVILHDSAMTTRVLRLANSVLYNPTHRKLETVSYAIVVLGFEKVRNLALTVSLLESSIKDRNLGHVKKEMACAYHAATQAQRLAQRVGIKDTENIYIAALLHRLGQLMFCCFPYEYEEQLAMLSDAPDAYQTMEKQCLGFSLRQLTDSLITTWNLSPLLHDTLNNHTMHDQRQNCILLGFNIADCAKTAWDSREANRQIRAVSAFIREPMKDTRQWLYDNAKQAIRGLEEMGVQCDSLIAPPPSEESAAPSKGCKVVGIFDNAPYINESKSQCAGRLLRELTHLLNSELDLNHFLSTTLESIEQATGCDQNFILLYKGRGRDLILKQYYGSRSPSLAKAACRLLVSQSSPLFYALQHKSPCWSKEEILLQALEDQHFVNHNLMVMPIEAMGKQLGFLFSIKSAQKALTDEDFSAFQHFGDHVSLAFRLFIGDKNKGVR